MGRIVRRLINLVEEAFVDVKPQHATGQDAPADGGGPAYSEGASTPKAPPSQYNGTKYEDVEAQEAYGNQRGRGRGGLRGSKGNKLGVAMRFVNLFRMLNPEKRLTLALKVAMAWAASIITLGIVFIILCGTGVFPASVDEMKAASIFVPYMVKFALYILAGILGVLGTLMLYGGVQRYGKPTVMGLVVMWGAVLVTLATIALTIYLLTKDSEIGVQWWSYLIQALILVMRIALLLSIFAALVAVNDAQKSDEARRAFLDGGY